MHDGFPHGAYFAALLTFRLTCPLAGSHLRSSTFRLFRFYNLFWGAKVTVQMRVLSAPTFFSIKK